METKRMDLNLKKDAIFSLEAGNANLAILFGPQSYVEYSFSNFGPIASEIVFDSNSNKLSFKNSDLIELSINLYVPDNLKGVEVLINKGNIFTSNANCDLNFTTYQGGVKIINSNGNFKLDLFNGEINIEHIKGKVLINGDKSQIKIKNWEDASGDIVTNYGGIYIETEKISGDINVKSNGGKISFGIASGTNYDIIARGTDVINYLENKNGKSLGSPAQISNGNKQYKINIFSRTDKVVIANSRDLENISPDINKIFEEFDKKIEKSIDFNKISKDIKDFGQKAEEKAKGLFNKISSFFKEKEEYKKEKEDSKNISEKQQILNLLKEGKITAEEAEKLLKALK